MDSTDRSKEFEEHTKKFHEALAKCQGHTVAIPLDLALLMVTATKLMVESGIPKIRHLEVDTSQLIALNCLIDYQDQFFALAKLVSTQARECTNVPR